MSTVKATYHLTSEFRKAEAARTGNLPNAEQDLVIDLAAITPEQRAAIVGSPWFSLSGTVEINQHSDWGGKEWAYFSKFLSIEDVVAQCWASRILEDEWQAKRGAEKARELTKLVASKIERLEQYIADHGTSHNDYYYLSDQERANCDRLGVDHAELDAMWKRFKSLLPQFKAEREARDEAAELAKAARAEVDKAKAEADMEARLTWAKENGSDRLRRSLEDGYPCDRLYWRERCAIEYPGCVLDYEKSADCNDRTAPTAKEFAALDEMQEAHPRAEIRVMWLTDEPRDRKLAEDEYSGYEPFEQCAALLIDDPDYTRLVYKLL